MRGRPALAWPAASTADHIVTAATVSARLKERRNADLWVVEIRWTAGCQGATTGSVTYDGDVFFVDSDTGERIHAGGVVETSGSRSVSGTLEWLVEAGPRARRLFPELTIYCYESFPLHGGREVVVTGAGVFVPPRFGGGGGSGGGAGGGSGDYGGSTARTGSRVGPVTTA